MAGRIEWRWTQLLPAVHGSTLARACIFCPRVRFGARRPGKVARAFRAARGRPALPRPRPSRRYREQ